jgi:hypothetical protein
MSFSDMFPYIAAGVIGTVAVVGTAGAAAPVVAGAASAAAAPTAAATVGGLAAAETVGTAAATAAAAEGAAVGGGMLATEGSLAAAEGVGTEAATVASEQAASEAARQATMDKAGESLLEYGKENGVGMAGSLLQEDEKPEETPLVAGRRMNQASPQRGGGQTNLLAERRNRLKQQQMRGRR